MRLPSPRWLALFPVVLGALAQPPSVHAQRRVGAMAMPVMAPGGIRAPQMMMSPSLMMNPSTMMMSPSTMMMRPTSGGLNANPYAMPGSAGYGMGQGYGMGSGYGMSSGSGGGSGYGTGSGYGSAAPSGGGYAGGQQQGSAGQAVRLDWPLGVRLLADARPLTREVETLTQVLLYQSAQGSVNKELVAKAVQDIDELRDRVVGRGGRGVVPESTIEAAAQYLDNLKATLRSL
jgi:hypothetical protein